MVKIPALGLAIACVACAPAPAPAPAPVASGEGEGEGEGVSVGEGEFVGEGEGEGEGEFGGEGEGEAVSIGEGEGEGVSVGGFHDVCAAAARHDVAGLLAEREGWGKNATGGDPDHVYTVDTLDGGVSGSGNHGSLKRAMQDDDAWWIVFDVDGRIRLSNLEADLTSNKTIDGRGHDITVEGQINIVDSQNIIITDVRLTNDDNIEDCGQHGDILSVRSSGGSSPSDYASRDLWFHHIELLRGGDGALDLRGASNVTISRLWIHDHNKGMLMWKDADNAESPGMRVSMHHNFFDRLTVRGPRFHYGKIHYYNNYIYEWYDYGADSADSAQFLSENNVWQARDRCSLVAAALGQCPDPNVCGDTDGGDAAQALINDDGTTVGFTKSRGDLALNGAVLVIHEPGRVFDDPGYDYRLDTATEDLAAHVRATVGPRGVVCR